MKKNPNCTGNLKLFKYNLKMKLSILLIWISFFTIQANTTYGQPTNITLTLENVTVEQILDKIESTTKFKFFYQVEDVDLKRIVSLKAANEKIEVVLEQLLKKTRTHFKIDNQDIYLIKRTETITNVIKQTQAQQSGRISGKIVDDKGQTLPGAFIKIIELNKTVSSSVDGTYSFNVQPGNYTIEVSYISFQTKRIADVIVKDGQLVKLDVVLKIATSSLNEVVVKSSYKKESIAGLYAQQKNAASVTDGISAEQIAKTPDNNVGAVLKRVSGITTVDNKYVVVRGLTERYNQALVDGITMPNTDLNRRNFSFDVVPVELVSSIVVNKTATPDVSAEFVGGQVIVNTLSIPTRNFTTISIGGGGNTQSTGKDFLTAGTRKGSDYFGFDNGDRKKPDNLVFYSLANQQDDPRIEATDANGFKTGYAGAIEQGKKFNPDGFHRYKYKAAPNQNYRFTMGRLYDLNENKEIKMGFVAGVTYRNTQQINTFQSARGLGPDYYNQRDTVTYGQAYQFNTNLGAVLNGGIQGKKFKINVRNLYTRTFNEDFYVDHNRAEGSWRKQNSNFADPVFSNINQHKIDAEHSIGNKGLKLDWSLGYTGLNQEHKDTRKFSYYALENTFGDQSYYQEPNVTTTGTIVGNYVWDYRFWTAIKENDYNWALNISYPFNFLADKSLIKAGYTGWNKKRTQDIALAKIYAQRGATGFTDTYENLLTPERIGYGLSQMYYYLDNESGGGVFDADSKYHAGYLMLDQRFFEKLRLVYGMRAENFNLANRQEEEIRRRRLQQEQYPDIIISQEKPILTGEKNWNFLPSINATYSLSEKMNVRAAYSKTMIRPDFRETSTFGFPDPLLQATIRGGNLSSTKIENMDLRYEFYPSAGEILSVSGFYKYLDRPVELVNLSPGSSILTLTYQNQHSANNYGIEMEFRKSLSVISPGLANFNVFGNVAYIWSEIKTIVKTNNPAYDPANPDAAPEKIEVIQPLKRPLIGQSPYIINAGLGYQDKFLGGTLSFNRSGYRSYIISPHPAGTEFQRARSLLDLQLSGRVLKQKGEIKLNISNLLNTADQYYINSNSWEGGYTEGFKRTKGTDNYEPENQDRMRYQMKYGRSYNVSFTYNF